MAKVQKRKGAQRNKTWGMKRLRDLIGRDPRWTYSHFKLYDNPTKFIGEHALGRPRLLIRTDEGGLHYKALDWKDMPREDLDMVKAPKGLEDFEADMNRKRFQDKAAEMDAEGTEIFGDKWKRRKFLVLPTHSRSEIRTFGNILIKEGEKDKLIIQLNRNAVESKTVRMVDNYKEQHEFQVTKLPDNKYRVKGMERFIARLKNDKKASKAVVQSVIELAEKGLTKGHIKPGRPASISFLTWKHAPTVPEFYDWIDFEHHGKDLKK